MPLQLQTNSPDIRVKLSVVQMPSTSANNERSEIYIDSGSEYLNPSHAEHVLNSFNEMRRENLLTDVILITANQQFPCHRMVLLSGSKYFRAMFCNDHKESHEMFVEINGIKGETMEAILHYLYTSRAPITDATAQPLFEAADLLEISSLRDACVNFMETQLDPCNCICMREYAAIHALSSLFHKAQTMMIEKFVEVTQYEEFLNLMKPDLVEYISKDEINIPREEIVFEAIKRWVDCDVINRSGYIAELLCCVRLPFIQPTYFVNTVEVDALIASNPACQDILRETRKHHILGNETNNERTRPRPSTGGSAEVILVGGSRQVGNHSTFHLIALDVITEKWGYLEKLPNFTKIEYAVTTFKSNIIISGGRTNSKDVWLYQTRINNWVKIASLNQGRWSHQMVSLGGHAYCVGGHDGKRDLLSVERYDSYSNSWCEVSPLLYSAPVSVAVACLGKLYVIGEKKTSTQCKMQVYSPNTNCWDALSLPSYFLHPKNIASAATLNGEIYVLGSTRKSLLHYNPPLNKWELLKICDDRSLHSSMTASGGMLYITDERC